MVVLFTLVLLFVFYIGNFVLRCKDFYKNKISSFECGFVRIGKIQNSFSIHFFIMMLMFVIFDLMRGHDVDFETGPCSKAYPVK